MAESAGTETRETVAWLDLGRVVAIVAVVALHVSAPVVMRAEFGSPQWWAGNVYDSLVRWSVPVFVMISGALLLDARRSERVATFYRRRASRILLPLAVWTVVFVLWAAFLARSAGGEYGPDEARDAVLAGQPYFHLWFLYMLVGLYLITPALRVIVRGYSRRTLWVAVAVMFALSAVDEFRGATYNSDDKLFLVWFVPFLAYFLCGYLIATSAQRISCWASGAAFVASVAMTAGGCYLLGRSDGLDEGLYFYGYLSVTVIPMAIAMMWLLRSITISDAAKRRLGPLAGASLGIYLVHPIFLDTVRLLRWPAAMHPALSVPLFTVLIVAASLTCAVAIRAVPVLRRTV